MPSKTTRIYSLQPGDFGNMTRIASSSFEMWRDILIANEGPILDMIAGFATEVQRMRNRVFANDLEGFECCISASQDWQRLNS